MNIADFAARNALCRGNEIAISDDRGDLSHGALDDRIMRTAALLVRRGVSRGDIVGVCLKDDSRTIVLWLAVARLGAVFIPMDWRWTPDEQVQIVRRFRPRFVFLEPDRKSDDSVPAIRHDAAWEQAVAQSPAETRMASGEGMPFIMNMTSGTTGLPRGNVHTHETYICLLRGHWLDMGQQPQDRALSVLPLASAAGRSIALATVLCGGTVVFAPPLLEPLELAALVRDRRITALCVVPTILRGLLQVADESGLGLPGLRMLISVGAILFPEESRHVRERVSPHLINYYGSTGGGINTMLFPDEIDRKPGSVGRPAFGTEIEIVDENGHAVPVGETGRIRVRCGSTCWGVYPADPDDTTYFEGWHYPGDFAMLDADGYLFMQGRYNDIIIRGGSNVFAPEVERVLLSCDGVHEAAVIGVPDAMLGEDVVAFVVADDWLESSAIVRHCRGRLAAYKVPSIVRRIDALPRSSVGKILKRKLLEVSPGD
jgi:acyl-coenzyme A synthetase/AMP-(fatty) acid ligase